ncbi:hypothetical protein MBM_03756 [Drepanopeziza brunnea f. sp. 'multigermtubi' MB_m1]|uniref:Uncharacterized protein n=1 Tax=Marssonina brunnea f. sp. multigermtubi (strain MB_m1) TaxID=1072389 RepID=K1XYR8_MARBU|nr:uncharacterized protein MBM_03756 [Drepanopeziza brunnea f. sp. 'multigermtubi' MB_m1]EKD17984.1 hypothetical protein MBM_03756 [Drepanopeziza brunnea f. sp. 'multigermtubi' MB_m1]
MVGEIFVASSGAMLSRGLRLINGGGGGGGGGGRRRCRCRFADFPSQGLLILMAEQANSADSKNQKNICFCSTAKSAVGSVARYARRLFADPFTWARVWWSQPFTNGRGLVIGRLLVFSLLDLSYHLRSFRRFLVAYEKNVEILVYLSNRSIWRVFKDVVVGRRIWKGGLDDSCSEEEEEEAFFLCEMRPNSIIIRGQASSSLIVSNSNLFTIRKEKRVFNKDRLASAISSTEEILFLTRIKEAMIAGIKRPAYHYDLSSAFNGTASSPVMANGTMTSTLKRRLATSPATLTGPYIKIKQFQIEITQRVVSRYWSVAVKARLRSSCIESMCLQSKALLESAVPVDVGVNIGVGVKKSLDAL